MAFVSYERARELGQRPPQGSGTTAESDQAVARALANRLLIEEQQAHLLDEAARNAAGATHGGPEGGATPITPGIVTELASEH